MLGRLIVYLYIMSFGFLFTACGGTKGSGVFNSASSAISSTSVPSVSLRITSDGSSLVKKSDKQVQIGGVCNQGDFSYNEIRMTVKRSADPNCAVALAETSYPITNKGFCENGRFYIIMPIVALRAAFPCTVDSQVQYTVTTQIYSGASSAQVSAGPKYSTDITIQH